MGILGLFPFIQDCMRLLVVVGRSRQMFMLMALRTGMEIMVRGWMMMPRNFHNGNGGNTTYANGRSGSHARGTMHVGELKSTVSTTLQNFPRPLIKVGIVYALAWFQCFASLQFYSHWIGVDVLQLKNVTVGRRWLCSMMKSCHGMNVGEGTIKH